MTPPIPCRARRLAGWLLAIASTPAVPVVAQEFLPIIETRAVERVVSRVQADRASWSELADDQLSAGWDIGLIVEAAYDDNIFLSATAPESDVVMVVIPEVAYTKGNPQGDSGAFIRAAYRPSVVLYSENSSENRVDHDLAMQLGWRGKAIAVAFDGRFRRLGDVTADTGVPADRDEYDSTVRVAWYPREKIAIEGAAGLTGTSYDRDAFFDTEEKFGEVVLRYAYSPKTQLGLACRVGRIDVDGTGEQRMHRTTARFAWQPRQKIRVNLEAGVEHRSFDLGSETNPVAEGRISWNPRGGTEVYLSGYLRQEASGFFAGQNYELSGATVGISESLGNGWTAVLEGGYERASYRRVSGTGPAGRIDKILFVRPALEYELNDRFKAGLFYQYSRNDSNRPGFGYDDHQVGVQFDYQF
jgi:hypothetical protein